MDFYDMPFDDIRDYVHTELTNEQITNVLDDFEDEYNGLSYSIGNGEDGRERITEPDELKELNDRIVEALEGEINE